MKKHFVVSVVVVGLQFFPGIGGMVRGDGLADFFNGMSQSSDTARDDRVIEGVFRDEFDRMPTPREYSRYRELIREKGWTASDIRADLRGQDESRFQRRRRDNDRSPASDSYCGNRSRDTDSSPETMIRRAYEDILGREPDTTGLRVYRSHIIDDGWTEQDVRSDLKKSPERQGKTPESAEAIVRRAYQDVLGREPDAAGMATYKSKLLYEGWQERDVRSDLKKSSERRETGGVSAEQAQQMVRNAYRSVLGRDPDSSGNATFVEKIRRDRWSENDVANALRNSDEYRQKHGRK